MGRPAFFDQSEYDAISESAIEQKMHGLTLSREKLDSLLVAYRLISNDVAGLKAPTGALGVFAAAPKPRILCVDDDPSIRRMYKRALESAGYEVILAEDGVMGWELFQSEKFDAAIIDNDMPNMNGFDLIRHIREREPGFPLALASGKITESLENQARTFDVPVLAKPFDVNVLKSLIEKMVNPEADGETEFPTGAAQDLPTIEPDRLDVAPKPRILYAEDDELLWPGIQQWLKLDGFEVIFAKDGAVAWELLQSGKFAALVTDNDMPNMTGSELIRKVRAKDPGLPILFVGANIFAALQIQKEVRGVHLLLKPYDPSDLTDLLRKLISPGDDGGTQFLAGGSLLFALSHPNPADFLWHLGFGLLIYFAVRRIIRSVMRLLDFHPIVPPLRNKTLPAA